MGVWYRPDPMELYIEKEPAAEAVRKFLKIAVGLATRPQWNRRIGQVSLIHNAGTFSHDFRDTQPPTEAKLLAEDGLKNQLQWLQDSRWATFAHCSINFPNDNHYGNNANYTLTLKREAIYDKIEFQANDVYIAMKALDYLGEQYQPIADAKRLQTDTAILETVPRELLTEVTKRLTESAVDLRAATKEGLAHFLSSVATTDKEILEKLHAEYAKQRADIETQRAKLQAETQEQRKKLQDEIEAERQKLQQDRANFDTEKKKLDDRRSTHVRRELFQQLGSKLAEQKKVELSAETNAKLGPIRTICFVVAVVALILGGFGAYLMLTHHDKLGWMAFVPFSTGIVMFTLNALYYVRFSNAWLARHADLETRNQLLQFDMARASWFAEMLFEYKDEKNGTVPESVIRVMTKNLFDLQAGSGDTVKHPVDDVAAFLSRMNRIRIGEGEVEMDAVTGAQKKKG